MRRNILVTLLFIAPLAGCASAGHQFCMNSGHQKDSFGYKQCTANYDANRDLYQYCQYKKAVIAEGGNLNACLQEASALQNEFQQQTTVCQGIVDNKFSFLRGRPREEKQPTLTPSGEVVVGNVTMGDYYNEEDIGQVIDPFMNSCLTAQGWHNGSSWQDGKSNISMQNINAAMARLNASPVTVPVPVHSTVDLFGAVARGDVYGVRSMLHQGVNVNAQNYQGYTALHVAARRGNYQIVQMLVEEFGADPEIVASSGENVMAIASYGRQGGIVQYLTQHIHRVEHQRARDEIRHDEYNRRDQYRDNNDRRDRYYYQEDRGRRGQDEKGRERDHGRRDHDRRDRSEQRESTPSPAEATVVATPTPTSSSDTNQAEKEAKEKKQKELFNKIKKEGLL